MTQDERDKAIREYYDNNLTGYHRLFYKFLKDKLSMDDIANFFTKLGGFIIVTDDKETKNASR